MLKTLQTTRLEDDLALEVKSITKQLHTQTLEPSSPEQLMLTQPKDQNNKIKPAY